LAKRATLIPLFVEDGPAVTSAPCPDGAGSRTVIVAGFIFESKGYDLMIQALSLLPDVRLVLVGGPRLGASGSHTSARLMALARQKGLAERVHMTGYLPEEEYHRHLAAADLAVCPFEPHKSASASLSSLIAAGCPILASDTPLIAEYNAIAPGALATFSPYTPEALAHAISELLRKPRSERTHGLGELRKQLSIRVIYDRHLEMYRRIRDSR
jgi:glycosyltransferase involved in cell wall biosynthesis